jgi:predicted nuclease of predicted toxin-antitoxin system
VRLLLDECVDRRLARDISGHEVATVVDLGWAGVRNGALLARAAGQFDVFVTVDRNLAFQQRIDNLPFAVVVLRARTNRLVDLKPLIPLLLQLLPNVRPGEVNWVEG